MTKPRPRRKRAENDATRKVLSAMAGAATALLLLSLMYDRGEKPSTDNNVVDIVSPAAVRAGSGGGGRVVDTIRLRSGLEMPAIGYGTCCRPSAKGEAIYESTRIFLENGGRLIDTAMAYRNHREIGKAVRKSGVPRPEIWITSKIAPGRVGGYDECLEAVEDILEELRTPYLDLLLIHAPKLGKGPTIELWECLIEAKRLGRTRAIGVSNFNRGEIEDVAEATGGTMPEANEIQQHPWSSREWRELARWQEEAGIATIAYTSLGGSRFHRGGKEGAGGAAWPGEVGDVARVHGVTEAQVLLRWALQRGMAVIPGSGSKEHIRENLLLGPSFRLSDAEMADIEGAEVPGGWWDSKRGPVKYGDDEAMVPWGQRKNG